MKHECRGRASIGKRSAEVQIVVNPQAGRGRAIAFVEPLLDGIKARGYRASVLVTEDRTHALRWAEACLVPPDYLICIGGDDTLDDLAPAAIRHKIPVIAVPIGFGNVCAQAFGHRAEIPAILDLLESGRRIDIDVGLRRGPDGDTRVFLAVTIYGFIETIKAMGEHGIERGGGMRRMLGYLLATVKWLSPSQVLPSVTVEVDGEMLTPGAALVVVANVPVFPGKLLFTRDANPLDGLLEVCVVTGGTKNALLAALFGLLLKGSAAKYRVLRRKGRVVRIAPVSPSIPVVLPAGGMRPASLDGWNETLTILPRALPVLVPRSSLHDDAVGAAIASAGKEGVPSSPSPPAGGEGRGEGLLFEFATKRLENPSRFPMTSLFQTCR
jgi:diacylglycerol kinase family enzyme